MLGQIFIQNYISVVVFPLHLWLSKLQFYIAFLKDQFSGGLKGVFNLIWLKKRWQIINFSDFANIFADKSLLIKCNL